MKLEDRFWAKVDRSGDCWAWTASRDRLGYGRFFMGNQESPRIWRAHRVSYLLEHGHLTPGLVIDHLCRNPSCVRPDHLEEVTQMENIRRSPLLRPGARAHYTRGEFCKSGRHRMSESGHIGGGKWRCHFCELERDRAYKARKRAERKAAA